MAGLLRQGLGLAVALGASVVCAAPAWANYQVPLVAVRAEGDPSMGLQAAMVQELGRRPRFRYWPVGNPQADQRSAWLAQARRDAARNPASGQAYALLLQLSRGPMRMGTPQEETREPARGRTERWLVASIEQELTVQVSFLDLHGTEVPLLGYAVSDTMRRRFEVELTGLNGLQRTAKGMELGQRLGLEMRRPPNEVFATVLDDAARSLSRTAFQRVAELPLFQLHAEVVSFQASQDRATIPLGSEVGVAIGDAFEWSQPSGIRAGLFRVRAVGPQSSELQPILWGGPVPTGLKLVESGRGASWLGPFVGGAFFGAPMVGGGLRLSAEAARLYGQADGYFVMEGAGYLGPTGQAGWGGVGVGGRSFVRATGFGWRVLGGGLMASPLTGGQLIPAASVGLSVDRLLSPGLAVGAEISPVVGWPVQLPGSAQAQFPLGGMAQVGVHLVF